MPDRLYRLGAQPGLNRQWDPLEVPEGALAVAEGVLAIREGMLVSRPGLERLGAAATFAPKSLLAFAGSLVRHHGSVLEYDAGGGAWTAYPGSYQGPEGGRIRAMESRLGNFYATSAGVLRQSAIGETPYPAGLPEALDIRLDWQAPGVGATVGFLARDSAVAYRVTYRRRDQNQVEIRSAPSRRLTLKNPAFRAVAAPYSNFAGNRISIFQDDTGGHGLEEGNVVVTANASDPDFNGTWSAEREESNPSFLITGPSPPVPATGTIDYGFSVNVKATIPLAPELAPGDEIEIWRTKATAAAIDPPGEEFFRVAVLALTAADVSAGEVAIVDDLLEELLGERLYTSPSRGSIGHANKRPPICRDMVEFSGHVLYVGAEWEHELIVQLGSSAFIADVSALTIAGETYTASAAEDVATKKFAIDSTSATEAERIANTMRSLVYVVNRGSQAVFAYYESGESGEPGKVLLRQRALASAAFSVLPSDATVSALFSPALPLAGLLSKRLGGRHVLGISKFEQPDHVAFGAIEPLGSERYAALRAVALQDAAIIWKEDGVFSVTGESDGDAGIGFVFRQIDPGLRLIAPDTVAVVDNLAFCLAREGVAVFDSSGAKQPLIGRPIDPEVRISLEENSAFASLAFAIAVPEHHLYLLSLPKSAESWAAKTFAFSLVSESWTEPYLRPFAAAALEPLSHALYFFEARERYVLKSFPILSELPASYQDEAIAATITGVSTVAGQSGDVTRLEVAWDYPDDLAIGWLLDTGSEIAYVIDSENDFLGTFVATLDVKLEATPPPSVSFRRPIGENVTWHPVYGKDPSAQKQIRTVHIEFLGSDAVEHYVAFETDAVSIQEFGPYYLPGGTSGWGQSEWGEFPWGDEITDAGAQLVIAVPPRHQRARRFRLSYRHKRAQERVLLLQASLIGREIRPSTTRRVAR